MLARVVLVVLVILNLGIGMWWWKRPQIADVPVPAMQPPPGVPVLDWVDPAAPPPVPVPTELPDAVTMMEPDLENADADVTAELAEPAPLAAAAEPPVLPVCARIGPLADAAAVAGLRRSAGALFARVIERPMASSTGGAWRVFLPSAGSRQAADDVVLRIVAAGFSDYFVIGQGELIHAVALGQFRNRDGAQRRLDTLRAAGFAAVMQPVESTPPSVQLDVQLEAGVPLEQARSRLKRGDIQSIDCAQIR